MSDRPCPSCGGKRLNPSALAVTVDDVNIIQVTSWPVLKTLDWIKKVSGKNSPLTSRQRAIAERVIKEISERLSFLVNVGLDYLTLNRSAATLSGGEAQRIRLATQVGSRLVGVLYVLDEPSIGLHARDNKRLLDTLKGLRDLGNTVLVVEHDDETIRDADWIVDLGPAAGEHGGQVIAEGTPKQILANPKSLTGAYLSGRLQVEIPAERRI
jgi:excinuclease ABC subunit A